MSYKEDNLRGAHFMRGGKDWILNRLRLEEERRKREKKFDFDDLEAIEEEKDTNEKTLEQSEELTQ